MSGQSITDRIAAAQHSMTGSAISKAVCKATTHEVSGPKKKHLDCEYYVIYRALFVLDLRCTHSFVLNGSQRDMHETGYTGKGCFKEKHHSHSMQAVDCQPDSFFINIISISIHYDTEEVPKFALVTEEQPLIHY